MVFSRRSRLVAAATTSFVLARKTATNKNEKHQHPERAHTHASTNSTKERRGCGLFGGHLDDGQYVGLGQYFYSAKIQENEFSVGKKQRTEKKSSTMFTNE